jgi:hypothetical protein
MRAGPVSFKCTERREMGEKERKSHLFHWVMGINPFHIRIFNQSVIRTQWGYSLKWSVHLLVPLSSI